MVVLMEGFKRLRLAEGIVDIGIGLDGPAAKRSSRGSKGTA